MKRHDDTQTTKFTGVLNKQNKKVIRGIFEEQNDKTKTIVRKGIFRLEKKSYTSTQLNKNYQDSWKKNMNDLETFFLNEEFRFITSNIKQNKHQYFTGEEKNPEEFDSQEEEDIKASAESEP